MEEYYIKRFSTLTEYTAREIVGLALRWLCAAMLLCVLCFDVAAALGDLLATDTIVYVLIGTVTGLVLVIGCLHVARTTVRCVRLHKAQQPQFIELYDDRIVCITDGSCVEPSFELMLDDIKSVVAVRKLGELRNAVIIRAKNEQVAIGRFVDPDAVVFEINLYRGSAA